MNKGGDSKPDSPVIATESFLNASPELSQQVKEISLFWFRDRRSMASRGCHPHERRCCGLQTDFWSRTGQNCKVGQMDLKGLCTEALTWWMVPPCCAATLWSCSPLSSVLFLGPWDIICHLSHQSLPVLFPMCLGFINLLTFYHDW